MGGRIGSALCRTINDTPICTTGTGIFDSSFGRTQASQGNIDNFTAAIDMGRNRLMPAKASGFRTSNTVLNFVKLFVHPGFLFSLLEILYFATEPLKSIPEN